MQESSAFERLRRFLTQQMRMSHLYQPLELCAKVGDGMKA